MQKYLSTILPVFFVMLIILVSVVYSAEAETSDIQGAVMGDVLEEIMDVDDYNYFVRAIILSGVDKDIQSGAFTVFAPINEYWEKMDPELIKKFESEENRDKLKRFVGAHIVPGTVYLVNNNDKTTRMETLSGDVIIAKKLGNKGAKTFTLNGRKILSTDMHADGILYELDGFAIDSELWDFREYDHKKEPKLLIISK